MKLIQRTIECSEAARFISLSMDTSLNGVQKILLYVHLWFCKVCLLDKIELEKMRLLFQNWVNEPVQFLDEPQLSEEAKNKMKQKIKNNLGPH